MGKACLDRQSVYKWFAPHQIGPARVHVVVAVLTIIVWNLSSLIGGPTYHNNTKKRVYSIVPWRQKYSNVEIKNAPVLCLTCTQFRIIVDQVSSSWTSLPAIQSKRDWFLTGGGGEQTTLSGRNAVHHQFEVLCIRYDTHHQYKVSAN